MKPTRRVCRTKAVWAPIYTASRITSRHHKAEHINSVIAAYRGYMAEVPCQDKTKSARKENAEKPDRMGQGLGVTIKKGEQRIPWAKDLNLCRKQFITG